MGKITVETCRIEGLKIITPAVFGDERGYFMETYNYKDYAAAGLDMNFVQDNQSCSKKGVLRGLHFQIHYPQDKLVRVVSGEVFDVAVDLREGSETFGKWFGVVLSAENKKQFFIPKNFAHGFIVLSENVQKYFRETYGRETVFISNGITRPVRQQAELITEKFGLQENGYFLFLARIVPEKGLHYLIEAFREMSTDKKLVIAGGNSHSAEYMEKIHRMAAGDERIVMTDFVQGQVLEELYSSAYAFILPSDVEGMAISLLEAMSFGNCCLVSDICENTEVVEDKALTFRKGNVKDLRKRMEYLLQNPEVVEQYKRQSSDFICRKYNWDEVVEQTLRIYRGGGRHENIADQ